MHRRTTIMGAIGLVFALGVTQAFHRAPAPGTAPVAADSAAVLSDGEIAMIAVVAGNIDITYAHLAMALSSNETVRNFARTMLDAHSAVNKVAGDLVARVGIVPVESNVSRQLQTQARTIVNELTSLRGAAFDRRYAENELAYHQFVNTALREQFIPGAQNEEFREALRGALAIFESHEELARQMVAQVGR